MRRVVVQADAGGGVRAGVVRRAFRERGGVAQQTQRGHVHRLRRLHRRRLRGDGVIVRGGVMIIANEK